MLMKALISFASVILSVMPVITFGEEAGNDQKVCVVNLHKNGTQLVSQLKEMNCAKGDILYLSEVQKLGISQQTTALVASQVCDMNEQVKMIALQYALSSMCTYSGEVLPIGGSRDILKMGGLHKRDDLHILIKD